MPIIPVDACVCWRCSHVWLSDLLPGEKPAKLVSFTWVAGKREIPKRCANCKNPYWNTKRKYRMRAQARKKPRTQADRVAEARQRAAASPPISGEEIFQQVMKTIPKRK